MGIGIVFREIQRYGINWKTQANSNHETDANCKADSNRGAYMKF